MGVYAVLVGWQNENKMGKSALFICFAVVIVFFFFGSIKKRKRKHLLFILHKAYQNIKGKME